MSRLTPKILGLVGLVKSPCVKGGGGMCNLYSMTRSQEAMRRLFKAKRDNAGNLPPLSAIFPDYMAPIARVAPDGEREIEMMRWGMPCPPQYGGAPVTNIRNTASPHWRRWIGPESRCLVPATSFSEYTDTKPKIVTWFALNEERPLFAFAGLWTPWTDKQGYMGISYEKLTPVLVEAVKQLKSLFDADHDDIAALKTANDNQAKAIEDLRALVAKQSREFEDYKKAQP